MENKRQVFQADNPSRWKRFKWIVRILSVLIVLAVFILGYSIIQYNAVKLPDFNYQRNQYQKLTDSQLKKSLNPYDYQSLDSEMTKLRQNPRNNFYKRLIEQAMQTKPIIPLRAGFYVNWDPQSLYSLRANIKHMNMILPEWFFISDTSCQVTIDVDSTALNIIRKEKVAIVPMLSNFFKGKFNGDNVHRIIISPENRKIFIESLVNALNNYQFQGINIDLEDLSAETTDEYLIRFQQELFMALHKENLLVTQDIIPFDNDYNIKLLSRYNDLIFLMGYDEHNDMSYPGTIAAQAWIAKALEEIRKSMSPSNVVLCIPAYGYDWAKDCQGVDISYQDAITTSLLEDAEITYDNNTSNLFYSYTDDSNLSHQVYFTDAITDFNLIRASEDFGAAGVAIWRLGSEDSRLWKFFDRSLAMDSLKKYSFDPDDLEQINSAFNVDFIGQGEIMEIADVPENGITKLLFNKQSYLFDAQSYKQLPQCYVIKRTGLASKKLALTFDDGPDNDYTPAILKILRKYKIPATFFITGINAENNIPLVKEIYESSCDIGNHTLTHPNLERISDDRIRVELRATELLIETITGHSTIFFRPPYNTDAEPRDPAEIKPLVIVQREGFLTIGSSIDPNDWAKGISADTIVKRVIDQQDLGNIILLHDAGGNREQTVKALPQIIEYFEKKGFTFVTVSDLMGKTRDQVMPPIDKSLEKYALLADSAIFETTYFYQHLLAALFLLALILTSGRIISVAILAILQKNKEQKENIPLKTKPKVSIIVPGYNEEVTIVKTIENLLNSYYPNFEIIVVDDGSKDNTFKIVADKYAGHPKVVIYTKPNGGKASALNFGIEKATGNYLVCIDADTILMPEAISKMMPLFVDEKVVAVAGNVQVGNTVNLLTNWQSIEYISSQNFDRRAFDYINSIMVVPGAIGAFRKSAVIEVGAFAIDTLAEDCDLTLRLLRAGYRVRSCNEAISLTEAPETLKMFLKQRFRWTFGIMQSFWKHHDLLFAKKPRNLGWILLPNLLIFQLILPLLSPIVDIYFIIGLFSKHPLPIVLAYFAYFAIDIGISMLAFKFDKLKFTPRLMILFFIQRILYRQLFFYVIIKSYIKALKGELISWGFLKRTGNVK
jgi:cellulose synthase/poly-beta-1,6-N-acetylglucosamine synthase-like glycosyltransferase/peptidoglycan/xylan/chitin deacetylase (PgdA/CDA1 family)/spore germination protein YaaH